MGLSVASERFEATTSTTNVVDRTRTSRTVITFPASRPLADLPVVVARIGAKLTDDPLGSRLFHGFAPFAALAVLGESGQGKREEEGRTWKRGRPSWKISRLVKILDPPCDREAPLPPWSSPLHSILSRIKNTTLAPEPESPYEPETRSTLCSSRILRSLASSPAVFLLLFSSTRAAFSIAAKARKVRSTRSLKTTPRSSRENRLFKYTWRGNERNLCFEARASRLFASTSYLVSRRGCRRKDDTGVPRSFDDERVRIRHQGRSKVTEVSSYAERRIAAIARCVAASVEDEFNDLRQRDLESKSARKTTEGSPTAIERSIPVDRATRVVEKKKQRLANKVSDVDIEQFLSWKLNGKKARIERIAENKNDPRARVNPVRFCFRKDRGTGVVEVAGSRLRAPPPAILRHGSEEEPRADRNVSPNMRNERPSAAILVRVRCCAESYLRTALFSEHHCLKANWLITVLAARRNRTGYCPVVGYTTTVLVQQCRRSDNPNGEQTSALEFNANPIRPLALIRLTSLSFYRLPRSGLATTFYQPPASYAYFTFYRNENRRQIERFEKPVSDNERGIDVIIGDVCDWKLKMKFLSRANIIKKTNERKVAIDGSVSKRFLDLGRRTNRNKEASRRTHLHPLDREPDLLATPCRHARGGKVKMEMPGCCLSTQSRDSPRLVGRALRVHSHGRLRSPLPGRWYVYYHTSPAWVTIDRLGGGRDIRLSTATMRALDSRRPQPTSTFCLFPRPFLCLVLLAFVLHDGRARSVPRDEEGLAQPGTERSALDREPGIEITKNQENANRAEPPRGKLLHARNDAAEDEKVQSEEPGTGQGKISQPTIGDKGKSGDHDDDDESPENTLASLQELDVEKKRPKKDHADIRIAETLKQENLEPTVAKKRRRNDVAMVGKSETRDTETVPLERIEKLENEGIRRFDVQLDPDGAALRENVDDAVASDPGSRKRLLEVGQPADQGAKPVANEEQDSGKGLEPKRSPAAESVTEESPVQESQESKDEIPDYFRKSVTIDDADQDKEKIVSDENSNPEADEESNKDREFRYLDDTPGKSRRKSSTVYLNAEEKKIPDGEQQSIVEGQIKKLISIRDDALDAQNSDKLDEAKVLNSKREVGMDEVAFTRENVQNERRNKSGRAQNLHQLRLITPETVVYNILQDALESYPSDETLVSYVDPENETLKELLTSNQMSILQMAEKLLPLTLRQDYSDRMFSCVRRFEYFSCVKYFAWPMIKQYFPALPAFPDYQNWYPVVDWYPQYPILPFPSYSGDVGELPEVVDADATRSRKPRPEAVIIRVLQNTLKEQPRISTSPSFLDRSTDSYVALIPQDQLLTINMAEQLIPVSFRPEFVQKTVNCMKEYNYLTCIKYSTWPIVRQFIPTLPDISVLLPDFQIPGLPDIFNYVPEVPNIPEIPGLPDLGSYWPIGATPEQRVTGTPTFVLLKNSPEILKSSNEVEAKIMETLLKVRDSIPKSTEVSPFILTGNVITFTTFTKSQLDILRVVECLIPSVARPALVTEVLVYLQRTDNFVDCARYVMWPTIARYVPNLPEFPIPRERKEGIDSTEARERQGTKETAIGEQAQERVVSGIEAEKIVASRFQEKESRNKIPQNAPVISVTGTRFVPLFTEHPESVIFNILRSVQLQSLNLNRATVPSTTKNQQFLDLITDQQQNIVNIVDSLLPQSIRTNFTESLITCLRINNFIVCSRDVIWPTLTQYFPWLPNFPNFGILANSPSNGSASSSVKHNLTESSTDVRPLAETDVKTGQHGDTTVTITDTRFFPIFNEVPESVILNILKAVQISIPNLPGSPVPVRSQEFSGFLTEQQMNVMQVAESLLPVPVRPNYISKMTRCMREKNFLECTRDVTWPTIAQTYPFLPSFPNFGGYQNMPRIRFQVFLAEKSPNSERQVQENTSSQKTEGLLLQEAEERIENVLSNFLPKSGPKLERSYLDAGNFPFSHLTKRQEHIVRLVEHGIPDSARATYIARMLECTKGYNFVACTQTVSWPTLKEYVPSLPDFSNFNDLFAQLPSVPQISLEPLPALPEFAGSVQTVPGISQFPGGLVQLPDGISQPTDGIPQIPTFPRFPGYSEQGVPGSQFFSRSEIQGTPAITPSVGESVVNNQGAVPEYAGQPPGILLDVSKEKVRLSDVVQQRAETGDSKSSSNARNRRSVELLDTYYGTDGQPKSSSSSPTFPNITESEYLQLLIKIRETARSASNAPVEPKDYFVDTLNSTVRSSLTADQFEILKVVEDLDQEPSSRGLAQQVIQCITGFSFIRCLGIFIWPLIMSNLPSLPSFPSFGIFGRSLDTEHQVQEFFGMTTSDFEKELLTRKESIEHFLLDWYGKLADDKFQTNVSFLKIRGYGNGELGISFSGYREGRGAKLKDNKNLPSILTIISDIMEEVLDQRPDGEKPKKEKEKRERSIDGSREADIQFLKDSEEFVDIKRSMNDDEIITMFLDKIKTNDSDVDTDSAKYFGLEDAYNAFGVLFGPRLHSRLAHKLQNLDHRLRSMEEAPNETDKVDIVSVEAGKDTNVPKVLSLKSQVTYDFEKESSRDQEEKQRQKRAKNFFKALLEKRSEKYPKESVVEKLADVDENKIIDDERETNRRTGLIVKLPRLDDEIVSRKMTSSMSHLGRAMRDKMMQMMPGVGLVLSFLLQMAVSHARAAASMAGLISNMAMGSAMVGIIRDSFFGSNDHPQIKYVYDNNKVGPGISWPIHYGSGSRYRGL
ncbi:uncharacterized protein LOC143154876 [Ptiloglossa arizonensis]|uniref:uncharacterized protein LOC143154876 n=1 Tax=Ptiloglossa arizonensis TaxID=3350558 RepID=UPI003F9FA258